MIGKRRIDQVESVDVLHILGPIWLEKAETARRVKQRIKVVMDWAKAKGYRSGDNPVEGVATALPKHKTKQEHHNALPHAQLPVFIHKLREYDGIATKLALEFLILCASRTSEVLLAKWKEFDLEAKVWTIPAARMKAGETHQVPLAPRALEILQEARCINDGSDYVFPGVQVRRPLSNMSFLMALRRMEYGHITTHGFRSTFRDWCEEKTNFVNSVVEAALAHTVKNKVEAAYLRTRLFDKRRDLMDAWSQFATQPAAQVVRIRV